MFSFKVIDGDAESRIVKDSSELGRVPRLFVCSLPTFRTPLLQVGFLLVLIAILTSIVYICIAMWQQLFSYLLKLIQKRLNKRGESTVFTVVKHGENSRVDRVLREIVGIPVKSTILLYTQGDSNAHIDFIGGFEHRPVGDTCRMILKFQHFDGEPLKYYAWDGIVPNDISGFGLGIYRIWPYESYGIITGQGVLKTVLIEKCRK